MMGRRPFFKTDLFSHTRDPDITISSSYWKSLSTSINISYTEQVSGPTKYNELKIQFVAAVNSRPYSSKHNMFLEGNKLTAVL